MEKIGKVIIITGANCGIGYETALDLAKRNARIILACRDPKRAQDAVEKIKTESKNENVEFEQLDLASLKSIRDFSERINKKPTKLDILINNAGLSGDGPIKRTEDGFETVFGVNHLGPFLLTNLLLDLLKKSAPSRIINVSSEAHSCNESFRLIIRNNFFTININLVAKLNWDDLQMEKNYSSFKAYSNSKLANILFTKELAKRLEGTNVTAVSLHPGFIKTEIFRNIDNNPSFMNSIFKIMVRFFAKETKKGAISSVHCAIDDNIPNQNGLYFE